MRRCPICQCCSLLILTVLVSACHRAALGQESPSAPEAPPRPNILFALADDVSYPHMSAYGTSWVDTPAFDRVAREGLLFNRAYTPNKQVRALAGRDSDRA